MEHHRRGGNAHAPGDFLDATPVIPSFRAEFSGVNARLSWPLLLASVLPLTPRLRPLFSPSFLSHPSFGNPTGGVASIKEVSET